MRWRGVLVVSCLLSASGAPARAVVRVAATIFPLADMVAEIGGDAVEATTLLPAGASPHTFEPTPAQMRAVAQAQVLVEIGAGLDTWVAKLRTARGGELKVVTITAGLQLVGAPERHAGAASVQSGGGDPHVWLDPVLMRDHAAPAIAAALSQVDPGQRAVFEEGARRFQAALTRLDADIHAALDPLPHRQYVAFHSAWTYFDRRYRLEESGVVERFPGKEPSAQEIAALVQKARAAQVRAVVVEPQFTSRLAAQIASEFGARVVAVDPLGGPAIPGRNHYLDLMHYNAMVFAEALR